MQRKRGISLIVLVITIIVMIVLAGAIILSLNNSGIIGKANQAVRDTDDLTIKTIVDLVWTDSYLKYKDKDNYLGLIHDDIYEALENNGVNADDYFILVYENGAEAYAWKENVSSIVDGVPIPKGFVVSPYDGENKKDEGLVIYELKENEKAIDSEETQFESWTERNQYVWIPVDRTKFTTQFVRGAYGGETINNYNKIGSSKKVWELEVDNNNMPKSEEQTSDYLEDGKLDYITKETLQEARAMYESVKKYGGFYVARYEAGLNNLRTKMGDLSQLPKGKNVFSAMNKAPYIMISYNSNSSRLSDENGAAEVARSIYPNDSSNTTGVVSTLMYGVQWSRVLGWFQEIEAKDINGNLVDIFSAKDIGNFLNVKIEKADLNKNAKRRLTTTSSYGRYEEPQDNEIKDEETPWLLSTGALKRAKVANIYDLAGNVKEWTMESYNSYNKAAYGGAYGKAGSYGFTAVSYVDTYSNYGYYEYGFRPALYIK